MKTKIIAVIIVIALAIGVVGVIAWQQLSGPEETSGAPKSIIDDYDRNVTITNYPPETIVCLAPSATEIIFALDLEDKLVGVDNYAYYPQEMKDVIDANNIPIVGKYSGMSIEAIVNLQADLIIAAMRTQHDIVENLAAAGETAIIIYPQDYDDVLAAISLIGEATGQIEEANALVANMQNRAQEIADKTQASEKPRVYIEYSFNGGLQTFGSGSFADEIIAKAGGQNIFTESVSAYTQTSSEQVIASDPEFIIIQKGAMSENAGLTPDTIRNRVGWDAISAVQNDQIYEIDERLLLPGPAIIEALEEMAEILHPELFE